MGTRTLLNQPQTPPPYLRGGINARGEGEREREREREGDPCYSPKSD